MTLVTDARLTLLQEIFNMQNGAMEELDGLANEAREMNHVAERVREMDQVLRNAKARGSITRDDLNNIDAIIKEAKAAGVDVNFGSVLHDLQFNSDGTTRMAEAGGGGNGVVSNGDGGDDYIVIQEDDGDEGHKATLALLKALGEHITDSKDNLKDKMELRQLDMQRVTQHASSFEQLGSNLSKRFFDTDMAVIGNMRA